MTPTEMLFLATGMLALFILAMYLKEKVINEVKIDYYERELKKLNVDISGVENITFKDALDADD